MLRTQCGEQYGYEDSEGISPTEREFDRATELAKHRIVFLKRSDNRATKEQAFVKKVESQVVRKSFVDYEGLRSAVYASLVRYMEEKEIIRLLPWDATLHPTASLDDIDDAKVENFVALARKKRHFKMQFTGNNVLDILVALNLATEDGRLTNAALLLFAKDPQTFFRPSEVKCVQFYGTKVEKPAPFYQVFQGDVFLLVDQAKAFVMSHIDAWVGSHSTDDNMEYEIPVEAVHEALVNAIIHRDYARNSSVQVMLFKDRLEIWNPGQLPYGLTPAKLSGKHSSDPTNPILAHPVYLTGYIERLGTGTNDMIDACVGKGLQKPEFVQEEDFCTIIWRRDKVNDKVNDKVKRTQLTTNQRIVYLFIKGFDKVNDKVNDKVKPTTSYIAKRTNLSYPTVQRIVTFLVNNGFVHREGSDKTGYWVANK